MFKVFAIIFVAIIEVVTMDNDQPYSPVFNIDRTGTPVQGDPQEEEDLERAVIVLDPVPLLEPTVRVFDVLWLSADYLFLFFFFDV